MPALFGERLEWAEEGMGSPPPVWFWTFYPHRFYLPIADIAELRQSRQSPLILRLHPPKNPSQVSG